MNYKGLIKKSRTLDAAAMLAVLGLFEENYNVLRDQFGNDYGLILIIVAVVMTYLRMDTKGPVGDK